MCYSFTQEFEFEALPILQDYLTYIQESNNSNIRKLFSPNPAKDEIWVTKTDFIKGADNSVVREIRHKMSQKSRYHLNIFKNHK